MCSCDDGRLLLALLFLLNGSGMIFDPLPFATLLTLRYTAFYELVSEGLGIPMLSPSLISTYSIVLVVLLEIVMNVSAVLTLARNRSGPRILVGVMTLLAASAISAGLWSEALRDLAIVGSLLLLDPQPESLPQRPAAAPFLPRPNPRRQKAE